MAMADSSIDLALIAEAVRRIQRDDMTTSMKTGDERKLYR